MSTANNANVVVRAAAAVLLVCWGAAAPARVLEVIVDERVTALDGQTFGESGAYEKLRGRVRFSFDPANPANALVTDLALAPAGPSGGVEAEADFMVLRPADAAKSSGVALLEVSNRGGKASLRYFNAASGFAADPAAPEDFGDGLLMRLGLTLIWVGWQFDVPDEPGRLSLRVPAATVPDGPVTGLVRSDWVIDEPVGELALGHRNHRPYPVFDPDDDRNILYVREGRDAPRRIVPRARWRFGGSTAETADDRGYVSMAEGFRPGHVYELVYVSRDPALVGLGLTAIRDMMSYARFDPESPFPVRQGIAFGVSQTGRFLRHFLYQGFNVDERGRKVFDGLLIHTAGAGRGSFNHRFGQPSRDAHRFSAFFYPTDLYPFTSLPARDPVTGREEGLLDRLDPADRPRVMVTNTGYEYWGRAASLIHTTPDGRADVAPAGDERIYHLASAQHYVDRWPPEGQNRLTGADGWVGNPVDLLVNLRALLVRLVEWVRDDRSPPPSRYPSIADGTLVPLEALQFPAVPGLALPARPHLAYRADYGPRWEEGIVDRQPPWLGPPFETLVPQVDALGNELGGVRGVEVRAPLATYTTWSLRGGLPQPEEMRDFRGMMLPLPQTKEEAASSGDPRPAIDALYPGFEAYMAAAEKAVGELVAEGFLLAEDRQRVLDRAEESWRLIRGQ